MSTGTVPILPLGPDFAGRSYGVLGLARTGLATVAALTAAGARVIAWDDRVEAQQDAQALGAEIADLLIAELKGLSGIIVSPGVPINRHPLAERARAAQIPILGDMELFALARPHLPPHSVIGITGTNGKSTTTALIHHLLEAGSMVAEMGGNIGLPILGRACLPTGGVYVLELSSYQLDLSHQLACDIAVLTNITPDHLDRYDGDYLAYAASKERLFTMQHGDQLAVIAVDDDRCRAIASRVSHRLQRVSAMEIDLTDQPHWPSLQGPHNAQNVACAVAVARAMGLAEETIAGGLRSFKGLAHRMEAVATVAGVLYVNDSKATNAASAAPALGAWPPAAGRARIHWIVGGLAKGEGIGECADGLGNVQRAYLIGDAAAMLARAIGDKVPNEFSGTLEAAVKAASIRARPGDVVLLSPAAASFDQFRDFEARGQAFRDAVAQLSDEKGQA